MRDELIAIERKLYNLYKLGEMFASQEDPSLVDTFQLLAEESLRHQKTLSTVDLNLKGELIFPEIRDKPPSLEELIREAIIAEELLARTYLELSAQANGSVRDILKMMGEECLRHSYRLKLMYAK
ncbi:rubrerythrin family protein [Pyrococcus kukulkanii]|uniref:Rubrerythrin family protein n=1 Tax=Pyrococcus kukulkanii TaxID=1609559 RepID=A0ABV4T4I4_9EURY